MNNKRPDFYGILKDSLREVALRRAAEHARACPIGEAAGSGGEAIIDGYLGCSRRIPWKGILIAAIVAISLLLTSCAAYVFREEIAGLWISLFDDHMHVEGAGDSEITEIETVYLPTYIPAKATLVYEQNEYIFIYRVWKSSTASIYYRQNIINADGTNIDSEDADYEVIELGGYTVHKLIKDEVVQLIWRQDDYVMRISTTNLGYEETLKIFESIERIETSGGEE